MNGSTTSPTDVAASSVTSRCAPSRSIARTVGALALGVMTAWTLAAQPASADSGSGSRSAGSSAVPQGECAYRSPAEGRVVDGFRLEDGEYGPGNRGLEYETRRGGTARAVAAGRVAFAGQVAGRLVLSIEHPDGRRSSLTGLASIEVTIGELVHRSAPVGSTGDRLHLGLRESGRYVDPAPLICAERRTARLVPVPGRAG